jgi:hypothetical protein
MRRLGNQSSRSCQTHETRRRRRLCPHAHRPGPQGQGRLPRRPVRRPGRDRGPQSGGADRRQSGRDRGRGARQHTTAGGAGLLRRPQRGPLGRPADRNRRHGRQPPLRFEPASAQPGDARDHGRVRGRADRGWPRTHAPHSHGSGRRHQPQALPAHEQGGPAHGHHRRVPGPELRHLPPAARRLRRPQPPAGGRGLGGRRVQGRSGPGLRPRRCS